jgi:hypothetical protein
LPKCGFVIEAREVNITLVRRSDTPAKPRQASTGAERDEDTDPRDAIKVKLRARRRAKRVSTEKNPPQGRRWLRVDSGHVVPGHVVPGRVGSRAKRELATSISAGLFMLRHARPLATRAALGVRCNRPPKQHRCATSR